MFDFIFGWRKAPKCKKLIRGVQCRLKLLKNKRRSIVRQLREDVALLLKHGHEQNAFDRVEQLFKDEIIVAVFDLLDHFCEFIIIHLSYIRRHKDCPNDINEAVSTLIFASARCGDLPELPAIRRLFGERYGYRFAMVAVELLPGNLVNREIKENLSITSVPNDVKYKLMDEIARTCLQPAPLALEYYPLLQLDQHTKKSLGDQVLESDIFHGDNNRNEASPVQDFNIIEDEGRIVPADYFSDSKQNLMDPCNSKPSSDSTGTSICSSTYEIRIPSQCAARTWTASGTRSHAPSGHKDVVMATESSSEGSSQLPEEPIYLDDIEEFKSPMSIDENSLDQRLFKFKSSVVLKSSVQNDASWNEDEGSRRPRKSRKASGKRQRRRSVSRESVKDAESTIYYGESCDKSPNDGYTTHHHRKHQKKIPFDDCEKSHCAQARLGQICSVHAEKNLRMKSLCSISSNRRMVHDCSLENPCYFCICDDKDDMETQRRGMSALEGCPVHNLKDEKLQLSHCHCSEYPKNQKRGWEIVLQKPRGDYQTGDYVTYTENLPTGVIKKLGREEGVGYVQSCASSLCSSSSSCSRATSPWKRKGTQPPYLRAKTMPTERPSDSIADNMLRSNSFPFQQPSHSSTGSPACRHVHPKLPDYDQLEATFMALKKANLQQKSNQFFTSRHEPVHAWTRH